MDTCKYVHYKVDYPANHSSKAKTDSSLVKKMGVPEGSTILFPPQVSCVHIKARVYSALIMALPLQEFIQSV